MTLSIEFKPGEDLGIFEGPMEVWVCADEAGLEKLGEITVRLQKSGDSVHLVGPGAGGTDMDAVSLFADPLPIDYFHIEVIPRSAFPTATERDKEFKDKDYVYELMSVEVTPRVNAEGERNEVYVYIEASYPEAYHGLLSFLRKDFDEDKSLGPPFGGDHLEAEPVVAENYVVGRHSLYRVRSDMLRTPDGHRAHEQECARRAYETYMALPWWKRLFTKPP